MLRWYGDVCWFSWTGHLWDCSRTPCLDHWWSQMDIRIDRIAIFAIKYIRKCTGTFHFNTYSVEHTWYRCCRFVFQWLCFCPLGIIVSDGHNVFGVVWRGPTRSIPNWCHASPSTRIGWSATEVLVSLWFCRWHSSQDLICMFEICTLKWMICISR